MNVITLLPIRLVITNDTNFRYLLSDKCDRLVMKRRSVHKAIMMFPSVPCLRDLGNHSANCCYEIKRVMKHALWLISECIIFYGMEQEGRPYIDFITERVFPTRINMRYRLETNKPTVHISFERLFFLCSMCFNVIFLFPISC
jgi:hypothetical protein